MDVLIFKRNGIPIRHIKGRISYDNWINKHFKKERIEERERESERNKIKINS